MKYKQNWLLCSYIQSLSNLSYKNKHRIEWERNVKDVTPTSYADEYMEQVKVYFYILKDLKSNIEFSLTVRLWYYHFLSVDAWLINLKSVSITYLENMFGWMDNTNRSIDMFCVNTVNVFFHHIPWSCCNWHCNPKLNKNKYILFKTNKK